MNVNVSKPSLDDKDPEDVETFRALLDTGATISSVSQKVVDTLSLLPDGWTSVTEYLRNAGGNVLEDRP